MEMGAGPSHSFISSNQSSSLDNTNPYEPVENEGGIHSTDLTVTSISRPILVQNDVIEVPNNMLL